VGNVSEKKNKAKPCRDGITVPKECCWLNFIRDGSERNYEVSRDDFGDTRDGETLIVDYDKDGYIISIELLAIGLKPCQTPPDWGK